MSVILRILPCLQFLSQLDFRDFNEAALFGMDIEFHVTTIQLTGVEREIGTFGEKRHYVFLYLQFQRINCHP